MSMHVTLRTFDPGEAWYKQMEEYSFLGWRPGWLCILQPDECGGDGDNRRWRHPGMNISEAELIRSAQAIAQGYSPYEAGNNLRN